MTDAEHITASTRRSLARELASSKPDPDWVIIFTSRMLCEHHDIIEMSHVLYCHDCGASSISRNNIKDEYNAKYGRR